MKWPWKKHRQYHIVAVLIKGANTSLYSATIKTTKRINSSERINEIRDAIKSEESADHVTITNWIELKG